MKKVLITGKNSYIGTAFVKWISQPEFSGIYETDTVDMCEKLWMQKEFSGYDTVLHVAGIAHADTGKLTAEQKKQYYHVNCDLAVETAEKAKKEGVKQFIYMSSIIVYGEGGSLREKRIITRETKPAPSSAYGGSKWKAEQRLAPLATEHFKVVILRPPMIYGEGCKGNYRLLAQLARKLPVFPEITNERSMLYIYNLCEFLRLLIEKGDGGIYFPQNAEYVNTSGLVRMIAERNEKNIRLTKCLNGCIRLLGCCPGKIGGMVNKAFGSVIYDIAENNFPTQYQIYCLEDSVKRTERVR